MCPNISCNYYFNSSYIFIVQTLEMSIGSVILGFSGICVLYHIPFRLLLDSRGILVVVLLLKACQISSLILFSTEVQIMYCIILQLLFSSSM